MDTTKFITEEEFKKVKNNEQLLGLVKEKDLQYTKVQETLSYLRELRLLQIELVKLQHHIAKENKRVAIILKVEMLLEKEVILEGLWST